MSYPVYAVPPTIATAVILALAVTALFYGRRDRMSVSFALFCFAWSVVAGSVIVFQLTGSPSIARLVPSTLWITYAAMSGYICVLTSDSDFAPPFGVQPKHWLGATTLFTVAAALICGTTDFVIATVRQDPEWGYSLVPSRTAFLLHLPIVALTMFGLVILHRAWRAERAPARRLFLRNNLFALLALILSAVLFAGILPQAGLPTFAAAFDAFALIAFFFFGVLANFQFRQVEELNMGLEAKVAARTLALREAQAQLVHAEKMLALGRLVAGVAHEINNPLGAIRSAQDTQARAAEALLETARSGTGTPARLERIERVLQDGRHVTGEGVERIDTIVRRLKSFAKLDESDLQATDVNTALDEVVALLDRELTGVVVERQYAATKPVVCRARQMNQVFLNLLLNAAQAVDHDGHVCVGTRDTAEGVEIYIRDDGPGVAPDHLPHVFDPGFTTRGSGVGMGMGLAIADRVIDDHGGTIKLESERGAGVCVTVRLPWS